MTFSVSLISQIIAAWDQATDEARQQAIELLRRKAERSQSAAPGSTSKIVY